MRVLTALRRRPLPHLNWSIVLLSIAIGASFAYLIKGSLVYSLGVFGVWTVMYIFILWASLAVYDGVIYLTETYIEPLLFERA